MKKSIILLGVLASGLAYSQVGRVGVNTENPKATFEITPNTANAAATATTNEGILIPRVSRVRLNSIDTANLTESTMVYVNNISGSTSATTTEVNSTGYYYYDQKLGKWTKLATKYDQDLRMIGNSHITQDAGVGSNGTSIGTSAAYNIVIGRHMKSNTTGSHNTAIGGSGILDANTTGTGNIGLGSGGILTSNTSGRYNIGIGNAPLYSNTTGMYNIGIGYWALRNNNGNYNLAIGQQALDENVSGNYNVALGADALRGNTSSSHNVAIGRSSMSSSSAGGHNIGIGARTLQNNTGSNNIAIGPNSLSRNTSGLNNIGLGANSLLSNTTGISNIAFGNGSLYNNTTGNNNLAIGLNSLNKNTTGGENVALGNSSMLSNTTGANNMALGLNSLRTNTTGNNNVAVGIRALYNNTTGNQNTAHGTEALFNNTTGQYNVGLGYRPMYNNSTGFNNTALGGNNSGGWIKGNGNIHLGNSVNSDVTTELDNVIAIGNGLSTANLNASTGKDNTILLGHNEQGAPNVGIGTFQPTEKVHAIGNILADNGSLISRFQTATGVGGRLILDNTRKSAVGARWMIYNMTGPSYANALEFWNYDNPTTSSNFRVAFTDDGKVGIGTRAPQAQLDVVGDYILVRGAGSEMAYIGGDNSSNRDVQVGSFLAGMADVTLWNTADRARMNLQAKNIHLTGTLSQASDSRLKTDVRNINNASTTLAGLRPVTYKWNADGKRQGGNDKLQYGFIAQEVEKVLPNMVNTDNAGFKSVNYTAVIPVLVKSLQEKDEEIKDLKARLDAIEKKLGIK